MAAEAGVNGRLKVADPMIWVSIMYTMKEKVEEIIWNFAARARWEYMSCRKTGCMVVCAPRSPGCGPWQLVSDPLLVGCKVFIMDNQSNIVYFLWKRRACF